MSLEELCSNTQNQGLIKGVTLSTTVLWGKKRPTMFCNIDTREYIKFNLNLKQFAKLKEKFSYLFLHNVNTLSTLSIFFPIILFTNKRRQAVNLVL